MRIILASVIGVVVGALSSLAIVSLKRPVFEWEMAGMIMMIACAAVGGISSGLSSALLIRTRLQTFPKSIVGLCIGSALGLAVGFLVLQNSSATHPDAPEGLAFWVVAMVVIAGAISGLIGGLLATPNNPTN